MEEVDNDVFQEKIAEAATKIVEARLKKRVAMAKRQGLQGAMSDAKVQVLHAARKLKDASTSKKI